MNKIKYWIIILIMLLAILITTLIYIRNSIIQNYDKDSIIYDDNSIIEEDDLERQDKWVELDEYTTKEKDTYKLFTLDDLIQKSFDINTKYYISDAYCLQTYEKATYYTYGVSLNVDSSTIEKCYLKMNIDYINSAYEIKDLTQEEYNNAKAGNINKMEEFTIVQNLNNKYDEEFLSTAKIIQRYIEDFKFKVKYMPDEAYNLLDDEYKKRKYNSIEDFKIYIQTSGDRLDKFEISQMRKRNWRRLFKVYCC